MTSYGYNTCKRCEGTKKVWDYIGPIKCPLCKGTGRVKVFTLSPPKSLSAQTFTFTGWPTGWRII